MRSIINFLALYVAATTAALACELEVDDPWVREAPPTASTLAGYMVLNNNGGDDCILVSARAAEFEGAMFHRTEEEGGVTRMMPQKQVTVPAHEQVVFKPGGFHIMLMQPVQPLKEGDVVEVTLVLDSGDEKAVGFPVRRAPAQ